MADDINIKITGDSKDIKKVLKTSDKLVKRFGKAHSNSTKRRVRDQERAAKAIQKSEEQKNRRLEAMERRLSRKRARIRLKRVRDSIRSAKREATAIKRIRKKSFFRIGRAAKFGLAGLGIGGAAGVIFSVKRILNFDKTLQRIASQAKITKKEQLALRDSITETSIAAGVSRNSLLQMVKVIVDQSGAIKLLQNDLGKLGKVLQVEGEEGANAVGELLASLAFQFKGTKQNIFELLEVIIAIGDEGALNTESFARQSRKLVSAFVALGPPTKRTFAEFNALFQLFSGFGSAELAATGITQFKVFAQQVNDQVVRLSRGQIRFVNQTTGNLESISDILEGIGQFTKGNTKEWNKLGLSTRFWVKFWDSIGPLINKSNGEIKKFVDFTNLGVDASGNMDTKFQNLTETAGFAFDQISAIIEDLTDRTLKKSIEDLAKVIRSFFEDPEKVKQLQETFEKIGIAASNLLNFLAAFGLTERRAKKEFRGRKKIEEEFEALPISPIEKILKKFFLPREIREKQVIENRINMDVLLKVDQAGRVTRESIAIFDQNNFNTGKTFIASTFDVVSPTFDIGERERKRGRRSAAFR